MLNPSTKGQQNEEKNHEHGSKCNSGHQIASVKERMGEIEETEAMKERKRMISKIEIEEAAERNKKRMSDSSLKHCQLKSAKPIDNAL